jgi:aminoglycoside phosphotransferase (APT) family kinase protein
MAVFDQRRANLGRRGIHLDQRHEQLWRNALEAPVETHETWIHGDLHPRNVLVRNGKLSAVLDWGDIARGDPATDLAAVWLLLGDIAARERAIACCQSASSAGWRRGRGWALLQAMILLDAGLGDDDRMAAMGRAALARLLDGP